MISVNGAIELIRKNTGLLSPVSLPLRQAYSKVLAENLYAGLSIPAFDQAAMDGYAIRFADFMQTKEFIVSGEVAAGSSRHMALQSFHAVRIFTGAAIPDGYDTVVMQEKTDVNGNCVIIKDELLAQGTNVRREGTEIKKGELALPEGVVLTPAAIGFLAALGITDVKVYPKPTVHIIVTGNELQTPGTPLQYGQVYESNSVMLQTALEQLHITDCTISVVGDNASEITTAITKDLAKADLVLLTGGVSVGNYDFVVEACGKAGVEQLFHKVAQRPGKPLYCGRKDRKIIFGLPGNPAS
ncbi:MAG TPA: molybdopterin molybdotransferase MoeA, partial [Flavisolibacter sp.]|nr:molybdopterin molybdotransferase MoeA [Flavisolibacter sp.]